MTRSAGPPSHHDGLGAGVPQRGDPLLGRGRRRDDHERRLRDRLDEARVEREPGLASRTRPGSAGGASPTSRAVSSGSSASAVPIPTQTASASARQRCASRRLSSLEIHFESPPAVATRPSSVMADFSDDERAPGPGVLSKRLVQEPGRVGLRRRRRPRPRRRPSRRIAGPRAARLLARVVGGDHHPCDAGVAGSRRRTAAGGRGARTARASRSSVAPAGSIPRARESSIAATSACGPPSSA